jgi:hypothetical protein
VLIAVGFCFLQPAATRSLWWQQAQNEEKDSRLAAQMPEKVIHNHTSVSETFSVDRCYHVK